MSNTANEHIDAGSRFWTSTEHGGPTDARPYESTAESVHDDVASAFREASSRAERDEQVERARPDIEYHQARHGSLGAALEFDRAASHGLRDPDRWHSTAQHLYRTFSKLPPAVLPAKEADEKPPFDDLDDRGRRSWEADADAARAYRDVMREKAYREDVAAAAPQLAQLAMDHPNVPLDALIAQGSAAKQALEMRPDVAWKLAKYGAAPADAGQAQDMAQTRQAQQWTSGLMEQVEQAKQSGAFAGVERPVAEHMADFFQHLAATGQTVDYNAAFDAAHQYATAKVQDENVARAAVQQAEAQLPGFQHRRRAMAEVVKNPQFRTSGSYEQDLQRAYQIVCAEEAEEHEAEQKAAAEKARHASKSISGSSSGADMRDRDVSGGSIEDDARSAYRSLSGNRV
jgi:hypothetical protein